MVTRRVAAVANAAGGPPAAPGCCSTRFFLPDNPHWRAIRCRAWQDRGNSTVHAEEDDLVTQPIGDAGARGHWADRHCESGDR